MTDREIEQLIDDLAKPIFVFRMARAALRRGKYGRHGETGAISRQENATREIRRLIEEAKKGN